MKRFLVERLINFFQFVYNDEGVDVIVFFCLDCGKEFVDYYCFFFFEGFKMYVYYFFFEIYDFDVQVLGYDWLCY